MICGDIGDDAVGMNAIREQSRRQRRGAHFHP
jgi:hypothetical protein